MHHFLVSVLFAAFCCCTWPISKLSLELCILVDCMYLVCETQLCILVEKAFAAHYIDSTGFTWCLMIGKDLVCAFSYTGEGLCCSLYWFYRIHLVFNDRQRLQLCILVYWSFSGQCVVCCFLLLYMANLQIILGTMYPCRLHVPGMWDPTMHPCREGLCCSLYWFYRTPCV